MIAYMGASIQPEHTLQLLVMECMPDGVLFTRSRHRWALSVVPEVRSRHAAAGRQILLFIS